MVDDEWKIRMIDKLIEAVKEDDIKKMKDISNTFYHYIPKYIYRYRGANKYSLMNLANLQIALSKPSIFNDPYDSMLSMNPKKFVEKNYHDFAHSLIDDTNDNSFHNEMKGTIADTVKYQIDRVLDISERFRNKLYIACFSEVMDSILMWSHYASYHQGFCIEYSTKEINSLNRMQLLPVIYQNEYINFFNGEEKEAGANVIKSAYYKAEIWNYEKEWRYVITKNSDEDTHLILKFPKPRKIYIGCRMKDDYKEELLRICNELGIAYEFMKMDDMEFKLISTR